MLTITGTCNAFINPEYSLTTDEILQLPPNEAIGAPIYSVLPAVDGWVCIGSATITLEFLPNEQVFQETIALLKAQKRKLQADAEVKLNNIQSQIDRLLCLEHKTNDNA